MYFVRNMVFSNQGEIATECMRTVAAMR